MDDGSVPFNTKADIGGPAKCGKEDLATKLRVNRTVGRAEINEHLVYDEYQRGGLTSRASR